MNPFSMRRVRMPLSLALSVLLSACSSTSLHNPLIRNTPVAEPVSVPTQAHYVTGNLALRRDDLDSAVAAYRSALVASPSMYEARYNLGIALLKQARAEFLMYAGLAPDSEDLEPIAPLLRCLEAFVGEASDADCG